MLRSYVCVLATAVSSHPCHTHPPPSQAFIKGKLKVKGNMALAMKLQTVLEAAKKDPSAKL